MKHNVILVVLDGLNYEVARHALGHLQAYCGAGRAALYKLECELPSLSRPLYECIMTGMAPIDSGIVHNDVVRLSKERSIFHYARAAGLSTAAAAYHWISELYNRAPFDAARDRQGRDEAQPRQPLAVLIAEMRDRAQRHLDILGHGQGGKQRADNEANGRHPIAKAKADEQKQHGGKDDQHLILQFSA